MTLGNVNLVTLLKSASPLLHCLKDDQAWNSDVLHVHEKCMEWNESQAWHRYTRNDMDLDLNLPAEDDYIEPPLAGVETIDESPDPVGGGGEDVDDEGSARGQQHNAAPQPTSNPSGPTSTVSATSTTQPDLADEDGGGVGGNEEVASSPQQPILGMRFNSLYAAREHYNAYALRMGFSMKTNTSRKGTRTNEKEKQTFVCKKHMAPKTEEQIQKERLAAVDQVSPVRIDSDDDDGDEAGPSKKNKW